MDVLRHKMNRLDGIAEDVAVGNEMADRLRDLLLGVVEIGMLHPKVDSEVGRTG